MINVRFLYNKFKKEEKSDIDFKTFEEVIHLHNKEVMRQIIEEARMFEMGFLLGSLMGYEKKRKIRKSTNDNYVTSVNWPVSFKRKKELEEQGKIPLKYDKDEDGKIIGDNGGEPWQIYHTSDTIVDYYWYRYRNKREGREDSFPLKRIRRYHLQMTIKNIKSLKRFKGETGIQYTKNPI